MTSKPKSKGNSFERELCGKLKEHFGGNWQRVPNSGAFTGGSNTFRKDFLTEKQIRMFKGDIIPDDAMPKIVLECKFYKEFCFDQLLKKECKQLDGWIIQTETSADINDVWFLCFKINRKGSFIVFQEDLKLKCSLENYAKYKNYIVTELDKFLFENKEIIKELCK